VHRVVFCFFLNVSLLEHCIHVHMTAIQGGRKLVRPGRFAEIPAVLQTVLKCPEILKIMNELMCGYTS